MWRIARFDFFPHRRTADSSESEAAEDACDEDMPAAAPEAAVRPGWQCRPITARCS